MDQSKLDDICTLIQLDIDAAEAYKQAIDNVDEPSIRDALTRFQQDHERHATELSALVKARGGTPPELKPDLKGRLIEGFTALRSMTGTKGALKAMNTNEMLANTVYERALQWDVDTEIKQLLEKNRSDERRHKNFMERALKALDENNLDQLNMSQGMDDASTGPSVTPPPY